MEDTEQDDIQDGMSFSELIKQAASIRTQQDAAYRRKFDSFPSWYQATLAHDEEVTRVRSLPFDEMMAQAQEMKNRGNADAKSGLLDDAIHTYTRCLSIFRWIENTQLDWKRKPIEDKFIVEHNHVPEKDAEQQQVHEYLISCYINLAIVYQKVSQWQESVAACDAALAIDNTCSKALYRRAQARIIPTSCGVTENELALADLSLALQHDPSNGTIKQAYITLRKELQQQKMKDKATFQGCLNRVRCDDDNAESVASKSETSTHQLTCQDLKMIINNLERRIDNEDVDETEKIALQQQLYDLKVEYTAAVTSSRQRIIDAILQIDMMSPTAEVLRDAAENGLDLQDEAVVAYMTSIQDKLRQGDVDFSTLPDEITLVDVLQHVHQAVRHDRATDTALKVVRSFNAEEISLMIRERSAYGGVSETTQYSTPTAILVEMIRDDILANESDDNTLILEKYGIVKEIERSSQNRKYWISIGVGVVSMLLFLLINLYRNKDKQGL